MLSTGDILGLAADARSSTGFGGGESSSGEFERLACEVFRLQAVCCPPYREYLSAIGISEKDVERIADEGFVEKIPFLPIEIFKTHRVYCEDCGAPFGAPEAVFTSSSTGNQGVSRHYVASLADYERVYTRGFELFYGPAAERSIYALLPSYLEREGSSLVVMAEGLIRQGRGGGFYLHDHAPLLADMAADGGQKILLGVSYALLDLAEELSRTGKKLPAGTIVMETGGMKGRREEMPKERMHEVLSRAFGVAEVHSEYGMAELMSQAYSDGGGVFRTPPWMRVLVRDPRDPFDVKSAGSAGRYGGIKGGIDIIDLANLHSCAFIQTQDVGTLLADGSFTLDGRIARSDIRGCNLLVQ